MKSKGVNVEENKGNERAAGIKIKSRWESKQTIRGSILISCYSFRGQSPKEEVSSVNMEKYCLLLFDSRAGVWSASLRVIDTFKTPHCCLKAPIYKKRVINVINGCEKKVAW